MSQLALANAAEVSQRHVSFLELGRTAPSREMVLRLAAALDLPYRQQNALLLTAGFAPVWRESALGAPEAATVDRALGFMLGQQEPFPAFAFDRRWNLLRANTGARRMVGFLTGGPPFEPDPARPLNLADALLAPDGLRPLVANWREVALHFVRGVRADALHDGTAETAALLDRLLGYPDVPGVAALPAAEGEGEPVLAMRVVKGETALNLFTTISTLGTPQDVAAQEVRVECFFPADEATANAFRGWAASR
ncbi:helix-turn-helix transcriptional regulator [Craurococcus roseus]|uniref:Helix-turn-helix transcriptional regulator n=2 Tax=Craurococcus roseus TaxID=77585 RepID=A0ABN1EYQ5_9PROT